MYTLRSKLSEQVQIGLPAHGTRNSQFLSCLSNHGSSWLNQAQANLIFSKHQGLGSQDTLHFLRPLRLHGLEWTWNEIELTWTNCHVPPAPHPCPVGFLAQRQQYHEHPDVALRGMCFTKVCNLTGLFFKPSTEHPKPTMVPCKFGGCIQTWIVQGCRCIKKCYFWIHHVRIESWASSRCQDITEKTSKPRYLFGITSLSLDFNFLIIFLTAILARWHAWHRNQQVGWTWWKLKAGYKIILHMYIYIYIDK